MRRLALFLLSCFAWLAPSPARAETRSELEREASALLERWAPVFAQETSPEHPEWDRPIALNFDGDWNATNNWRSAGSLRPVPPAVVHGAAILSETHAYLSYTLFYPRDWATPFCVSVVCHDNDLESLLVVTERGASGRLVLVESKAHHGYPAARAGELTLAGAGRPLFRIESEGHGIYPVTRQGSIRHENVVRLVPALEREAGAVPYELVSLRDTLWARRARGQDTLWHDEKSFGFRGMRVGRLGAGIGAELAQSEYQGGVRPPWGVKASPGARGDWFLDPAMMTLARHPDAFADGASQNYVFNPFLDDLQAECSGEKCGALPEPPESGPWAWGAVLLGGFVSLQRPRWSVVRRKRVSQFTAR